MGGCAYPRAADNGDYHGLFRPIHPRQRLAVCDKLGDFGRGDTVGVRGFYPAPRVDRSVAAFHPRVAQADSRALFKQVGRLLLSAVCGGLFHLYDTAHGERRPRVAAAVEGNKVGVCVGLLRGVARIHHLYGECAVGGEDGDYRAGGVR